MLTKTKKIALLTTGLAGTLLATTVAGIALSSCTFQVVDPNGNNSNSGTSDNDNAAWYTTKINWNDSAQLATLVIDDQGLVYANPAKTELIGVVPNFASDFSGGFANVVIPASVKAITGYVNTTPTTSSGSTAGVSQGAFQGMTSLTNVTFAANNVTRIGAQAFKGCSNLSTISLPSSVSYIGNNAFQDCHKLNAINLNNVSYIGNSAFKSAFSDIPASSVEVNADKVNYVGTNAFESTSGLKTVNFSRNSVLQTVSNSAFLNSGITSIDLSQAKNLLKINDLAFKGCSSLVEVKVPKSLVEFGTTTNGSSPNQTTTTSVFSGCSSLTTIDLSSTQLTTLPNNLFQGCTSLSNVKLPSSLTSIGESAFQNTPSLQTISIPDNVSSIGQSAFGSGNPDHGSGITSLDLSHTKLTSISSHMVRNCTSLTNVKLPATVTTISDSAFQGTTSLVTVEVGTGLQTIQQNAFQDSGLQTLDLSNTALTTINQGAFANTANLTSLKVPGTLTQIQSGDQDGSQTDQTMQRTFSGSALPSLDLSQTKLTQIATSTFNGAAKLATVKLPSTVQTIGQNAFKNTAALKTLTQEAPVDAPATRTGTNQLASTLTSIGNNAFEATGLESLDLSGTKVTGLSNNTFQDATSLSSVTLPTSLTTIAAGSFANTTALKSISLPSSVNKINAGNANVLGAFEGSGLESVDLSKTQVTGATNANTPGSWPSAGNGTHGTFSNMPNLTSVTLPAGLTTIPSYAFYNSPKLKTVSFKAPSQEESGSQRATEGTLDFNGASSLTTINASAFAGTGITTVNFAGATALTTIGTSAFAGSAVTSIDLNGATAFTTISNSAFMGMNELTTVKLPSTVTMIQENAFANNAKLQTLTQANPAEASDSVAREGEATTETVGTAIFGSSLTTIQQGAFQGTGFKVVDLSQANNSLTLNNNNNKPFGNLANLITVKLPETSSLDLGNFGGGSTNWSVQFGSNTTSPAVVQFSDATFSRSNYNRIINSTIEMQSSNASATTTLSWGVFNGNSTLTTLKLNRTAQNLSGNDLWTFQLGQAPSGTDVSAAYSTAPLGNNSNLNTIEFKGFTLGNTTQVTESNTNSFGKISETTWSQVASIMNMFSSWSQNGLESNDYNPNLTSWAQPTGDSQRSKINNWISTDLDGSSVKTNWKTEKPSTSSDNGNETIDGSKGTLFKYHNEVLWTYKKDSTTNEISLEGVSANLYKATSGSNKYQVAFNTTEGGMADKTKLVNIKLIIVPGTAQAQPTTRSPK